MAEAPLVKDDIELGAKLVSALDQAGFDVKAAAWIFFPDTDMWKLVIASESASSNLRDAFIAVARVLDSGDAELKGFDLSRISIVPPDNKMFAAMGSVMSVQGVSPVRFTHNFINGVYIDDALIYRLAA